MLSNMKNFMRMKNFSTSLFNLQKRFIGTSKIQNNINRCFL